MRRVRITLGYDGTEFFGSQSQPGRRTVQGELERLLERLAPGAGKTAFAGRTDRGVHAVGQVVSVDVGWQDSDQALRDALNSVAPADLTIVDIETIADAFHARYDARWREYRYRIIVDPVPPILERRYLWWRRDAINAERVGRACQRLVGEHPFGSFAGNGRSRRLAPVDLVRHARICEWRETIRGRHELRIVANGFLPQMVRNIVAALVEVGSGRREPEWVDALIAANDRRSLGQAAPPQGLVLWRVSYDDDIDQRTAAAGRWPGEGNGEE